MPDVQHMKPALSALTRPTTFHDCAAPNSQLLEAVTVNEHRMFYQFGSCLFLWALQTSF